MTNLVTVVLELKKAVDNVNNIIAEAIIGYDVRDQQAIDRAMIALDGTPNKGKLGANAILGVSIAVVVLLLTTLKSHFTATLVDSTLSSSNSMMNIINGGSHSDAPIAFQEFMIVPAGAPSFKEVFVGVLKSSTHLRKSLKLVVWKQP